MTAHLFSRAVAAGFVPGSGNVEVWLVERAERLAAIRGAARGLLAALDQHEDAADVGGDRHYHAAREDAVYGAKCALRDALRDSLTAAIEAATPKQEAVKAPRTCWTCRWAENGGERCTRQPWQLGMVLWVNENTDARTTMPLPDATPCPGFGDRT